MPTPCEASAAPTGGEIRVLVFANNRYCVYIETTGDQTPESVINVYSDHALAAADFVL